MNLSKGNQVLTEWFQKKMLFMMLFLVIIMKIVSFTQCQDLTGNINTSDVSQNLFSIPLDDLWPCGGKSNCFYQSNSKSCNKLSQFNIMIFIPGLDRLKPPPLVLALSNIDGNSIRGFFFLPFSTEDQIKPLELLLCAEHIDMLRWAKTSAIADTSLPPTLNMIFSLNFGEYRTIRNIKYNILEYSDIFVILFYNKPECLLVDDLNHKVFWSDGNRGTIESYDTKTDKIIILASCFNMPKSIVIDSPLGLLFWCNFEITGTGSIERINYDGSNRMDITEGKYDLTFPESLAIDTKERMLYWTDFQIIHTSDYNGNHHKILEKSQFYDQNFPYCIPFNGDDVEHNFFWEKNQTQQFNRSFTPNHLLTISYHKDGKALDNMKLPTVFRKNLNLGHRKLSTSNVSCPERIKKTFRCFLLPVKLNPSSLISDNHTMSKTKLLKSNFKGKLVQQDKRQLEIKWYVNSKIEILLYYDAVTKHIRFLFYIIQDMGNTVVYRYKANHVSSFILENTNAYGVNLIILDIHEKSFYFLNTTDNWNNKFNSNGRRIHAEPKIFSYSAQGNSAQSHTISIQKYVILTVFNFVLRSFTNVFAG